MCRGARQDAEGEPATEQCIIIDGVNFLNNADIDGRSLPPSGAPNIMMAAGGTQLKGSLKTTDLCVEVPCRLENPANTKVIGPEKIAVAPYHYLCDGQLTSCVPQPGTLRRLDAQGDKIMARLVYRKIGNRESRRCRPFGQQPQRAAEGCAGMSSGRQEPQCQPLSAGDLCARRLLPLDGKPRYRSVRQHRHRLLVRRDAQLRRSALLRAASPTTRSASLTLQ